jgi:hypothetical protein
MGSSSEGIALLLRLSYDSTGLESVTINSGPIVAWVYDTANLAAGVTPLSIVSLPPVPPDTAPIVSPQWAVAYPMSGGMVWAMDDLFAGSFDGFLTFLASNNGANRVLSGNFAEPALTNMFNDWVRRNQS